MVRLNESLFISLDGGIVDFRGSRMGVMIAGERNKKFQQRIEEFFWRTKVQNRLAR